MENFADVVFIDPSNPDNLTCNATISTNKTLKPLVDPRNKEYYKTLSVINSIKPGVSTQIGTSSINQVVNGRCIIPDEEGNGDSVEMKKYGITLRKNNDGLQECVDKTGTVVFPYIADKTQLTGCAIDLLKYKEPKVLAQQLNQLYDNQQEGYLLIQKSLDEKKKDLEAKWNIIKQDKEEQQKATANYDTKRKTFEEAKVNWDQKRSEAEANIDNLNRQITTYKSQI
jgi:hypothetical protein